MLKQTPFHSRTAPLVRAQTWRRWAGHEVASSYEPHPDREYAAIRASAALFDVSPLHKYRITGRDAVRLLDRMVTRDVMKCAVGQVLYTPWCNAAGKVIDDGTISRLDEGTFRLTSAEPNLRWLAMNSIGLDVGIEDISESTAAVALQGPLSRTILEQLSPADFASLKYFRLVHTTVRDIPVTISRTGYTGDLGYEVWVDGSRAVALWDALIDAGELLEHAEFAGNCYGTPRAPVLEHLAAGVPTLLEIELQGARQVRASMPDARFVFLAPPSARDLVDRLEGRGTESEDELTRRLQRAEIELAAAAEFDYVVINDEVERAATEIAALIG